MIFLAGPRQVGKTTTCLQVGKENNYVYLNWDEKKHRQLIMAGGQTLAEEIGLLKASKEKIIIIFDEIHKYGKWKQFLKGFFDLYNDRCHIIVTGSSKLNIYKKAGDSLMGRYFLYRLHPLSMGEILRPTIDNNLIHPPSRLTEKKYRQLFEYGGFPEPFLKENRRFSAHWKRLRQDQLIREDIRDLSQIQELSQLEMLSLLLTEYSGKQISLSSLANQINVSVPTISRWLGTLEAFYYSFQVKPWTKNVTRSLRKEPKYYLWDWTLVRDIGSKIENFVASHLYKAVHFWTDYGFGAFDLHYLRDKEKHEVDFLVTRDKTPWFLVEVKAGDNCGISKTLYRFQEQTKAEHAFQVSFEMDYIDKDCFSYKKPVIVPLSTFLSQLI